MNCAIIINPMQIYFLYTFSKSATILKTSKFLKSQIIHNKIDIIRFLCQTFCTTLILISQSAMRLEFINRQNNFVEQTITTTLDNVVI